ncbi:hypothetical protein GCM10009765_29400 [Fodinicola feengrottensis]|uniref:Uncharacterized protein n=1 Tax=Fodinicola feengrottensis TaxID=435914 RepID=A0ABN2GWY6_9ACTN
MVKVVVCARGGTGWVPSKLANFRVKGRSGAGWGARGSVLSKGGVTRGVKSGYRTEMRVCAGGFGLGVA